jgi:hypothetical protein
MYNSGCSPTVTNCIFDDNYAKYGGGMFNTGSSPIVTDCSFTDNEAVYWGGGVENDSSSSPTITRCIFSGNAVTATNYGGGAIDCYSSSNANIVNCTISENTAANGYAGGLYSDASSPTVTNTIFWNNTDGYSHCDFAAATSGTITIDYSDVSSFYYYSGTGNASFSGCIFDINPEFADSGNDDFHLKSVAGRWNGSSWVTDSVTSTCINGGDPSSGYSGEPSPNGDRINMGAYGNTDEASKSGKYHLVVYLDTDDEDALSSDMKWQLDGFDSTWRNSGEAVLADSGSYTLKCTCNSGTYYISPDNLPITVGQGQPISYTRTYKACGYIGYLCYYYNDFGTYTISGVGWRVTGESSWKNGNLEKYVPGNYEIEFKSVAEHDTPDNTNVTVTKGSANSGYYKEYQRNTFYVDVDYGSDSNKGGSMNRFLTIQKGFNMVPPKLTGDPDRWIYVESNYSTIYEDITFPLSNRPCIIRSYSSLTVRGDHTPNNCPGWITRIGVTFEEW